MLVPFCKWHENSWHVSHLLRVSCVHAHKKFGCQQSPVQQQCLVLSGMLWCMVWRMVWCIAWCMAWCMVWCMVWSMAPHWSTGEQQSLVQIRWKLPLCDSPLALVFNVMLHHYTLKRGLSFPDSSVSFATGYFAQTSKTQSAEFTEQDSHPKPLLLKPSLCVCHGLTTSQLCGGHFVDLSANQILYQTSRSAGSTKGGIQKTLSFTFSWKYVTCSVFSYEVTSKLYCAWCATGAASKPVGVKAGKQQAWLAFPRSRSIFLASQQLGFTFLEQGWGEKQLSPVIPRTQSNARTQTCMGRAGSLHSVLLFPWEKCPNYKVDWECVEAPAKDISRWGHHHLRNRERADKNTKYLECWETCLGKKAQRKALRN